MDDHTVLHFISARRKRRLTEPLPETFNTPNPHADVGRLCKCCSQICRDMPAAMQQRVSQVLAEELSTLLRDFCFDLSLVKHDGELDRVFNRSGLMAAVSVAFAPFDEIQYLEKRFSVGKP